MDKYYALINDIWLEVPFDFIIKTDHPLLYINMYGNFADLNYFVSKEKGAVCICEYFRRNNTFYPHADAYEYPLISNYISSNEQFREILIEVGFIT